MGTETEASEVLIVTAEIPVQPDIPEDTLPLRVWIARRERKLSQRDAAALCGLTFGEWQSIEDGRAAGNLDLKVAKIAHGLRYDRDWLMWGGPLRQNIADLSSPIHPFFTAA